MDNEQAAVVLLPPPSWLASSMAWFTGESKPIIEPVPEGGPNGRPPAHKIVDDPEFNGPQAVSNLALRLATRHADPALFTYDYWSELLVQPGGDTGSGEDYPGKAWSVRKVVAQLRTDPTLIYGIFGGDELLDNADPAAVSLIQSSGIQGDAFGYYD